MNITNKANLTLLMASIAFSYNTTADTYVVPPTSSTSSSVPVISDAAMEECVKLYNEGKWLGNKINSITVNTYSQESVDNYNKKIESHSKMTRIFNRDCAGKQSQSAYEATEKLNKQLKNN